MRCALALAVAVTLCSGLGVASAEEAGGWNGRSTEQPALAFSVGSWTTTLEGYVRSAFSWVGPSGDNRPEFVGANNGFALLDARLAAVVRYVDTLEIRVQLDGAGDTRSGVNDAVGTQTVTLKDAYGAYRFGDFLTILVGQSKTPIDLEAMQSTGDLTFIRRSVVSEGVRPGEGIERPGNEGLGAEREVGLNLKSDVIDFGPVGLFYHAAITNGTSGRHTRNDNDKLAYYGRLELHLRNQLLGQYAPGSFVVLGGSVGYNERTEGELPTQLAVDDLQWAADLQFKAFGVDVLGEVMMRTRAFPDTGQDDQETLGIVAQAAYRLPIPWLRFQLGFRYARLDPFAQEGNVLVEDDLIEHYTAALSYRLENLPVDLKLNYTRTQEEGSAAIDNDLVEALAQFTW